MRWLTYYIEDRRTIQTQPLSGPGPTLGWVFLFFSFGKKSVMREGNDESGQIMTDRSSFHLVYSHHAPE